MMTVIIPLNDYKPVINEKNVQYICDAFLNQGSGCAFNDYVIDYDNCVRLANGTRVYGFGTTMYKMPTEEFKEFVLNAID